jgi:hypothetical protein
MQAHVQSSITHSNEEGKLPKDPPVDEYLITKQGIKTVEYYSAFKRKEVLSYTVT